MFVTEILVEESVLKWRAVQDAGRFEQENSGIMQGNYRVDFKIVTIVQRSGRSMQAEVWLRKRRQRRTGEAACSV